MSNVIRPAQFRAKTELEIEQHKLMNPVIVLGNMVVVTSKDGAQIEVYEADTNQPVDKRAPTRLEYMLLVQLGICEKKILLLLENYEPERIDPHKPPSASVEVDRLVERRNQLGKEDELPTDLEGQRHD